jgi:hypothetical protein
MTLMVSIRKTAIPVTLENHASLALSNEKSVIERTIQYNKNSTEMLDDYCRKDNYKCPSLSYLDNTVYPSLRFKAKEV